MDLNCSLRALRSAGSRQLRQRAQISSLRLLQQHQCQVQRTLEDVVWRDVVVSTVEVEAKHHVAGAACKASQGIPCRSRKLPSSPPLPAAASHATQRHLKEKEYTVWEGCQDKVSIVNPPSSSGQPLAALAAPAVDTQHASCTPASTSYAEGPCWITEAVASPPAATDNPPCSSMPTAMTAAEHLASCAHYLGLSARTLTRHPTLAAALLTLPRPQAAAVLVPALVSSLGVDREEAVGLLLAQPGALVGLVRALDAGIAGAQLGQVYKVVSKRSGRRAGRQPLSHNSHASLRWEQASRKQTLLSVKGVAALSTEEELSTIPEGPPAAGSLGNASHSMDPGTPDRLSSAALPGSAVLGRHNSGTWVAASQGTTSSSSSNSEHRQQTSAVPVQGPQIGSTAESCLASAPLHAVQEPLLLATAAALGVRAAEVSALLLGPGAPPSTATARSAVLRAPELLGAPPGHLQVGLLGLARGLGPHLAGGVASVLPLVRRCPALLAHPDASSSGAHVEGVLSELAACCGTTSTVVSGVH
jgi:hypothetical protein